MKKKLRLRQEIKDYIVAFTFMYVVCVAFVCVFIHNEKTYAKWCENGNKHYCVTEQRKSTDEVPVQSVQSNNR